MVSSIDGIDLFCDLFVLYVSAQEGIYLQELYRSLIIVVLRLHAIMHAIIYLRFRSGFF